MADIPVIVPTPATSNSYGDRLVVQYKADYPVHLCITDTGAFYPIPGNGDNGQCNVFWSSKESSQDEQIVYYENFMNRQGGGNVGITTRLYMTVWAGSEGTEGQGFDFNITLIPQTYMKPSDSLRFYFKARDFFSIEEYVNIVYDVRELTYLQLLNSSIISGAECNSTSCRMNPPEEFYLKSIITTASLTSLTPNVGTGLYSFNPGVQTLFLSDLIAGDSRNFSSLGVLVQYRHTAKINRERSYSDLPYKI